jgi:septal ring factor EnvC (AmiA/AmiB activator)
MNAKLDVSQITVKVAGTVIAAAIIGLSTIGYAFMSDKVDKETFEKHCIENAKDFERMQNQIDQQVRINTELLKTLNEINVKIERVETNTEWLIKEVKK